MMIHAYIEMNKGAALYSSILAASFIFTRALLWSYWARASVLYCLCVVDSIVDNDDEVRMICPLLTL